MIKLIFLVILMSLFNSKTEALSCWTTDLEDVDGGHHADLSARCVVDARGLMMQRSGYAINAKGAWPINSTLYVVDSANDSGPGTFRDAIDHANAYGNLWIVLKGTGVIKSDHRYWLHDTSNITIDGRYSTKIMKGAPLRIWRSKHLIITGIEIIDTTTAPLALHKVDFVYASDLRLGDSSHHSFSVSGVPENGRSRITLSHSELEDEQKSMLIGSFNDPLGDQLYVTLHNLKIKGANRRSPLVAKAKVHIFNSLINYRQVGIEVFNDGHVQMQGVILNNLLSPNQKEPVRHIPYATHISDGSYQHSDTILLGNSTPLINREQSTPWYTRGAYAERWEEDIANTHYGRRQ